MSMGQRAGTCLEGPQCAGAQMMSPQGHANIVSASTHSPYWKAVRKGIAVAFRANNMRCGGASWTAGRIMAHSLGPCSAWLASMGTLIQAASSGGQQLVITSYANKLGRSPQHPCQIDTRLWARDRSPVLRCLHEGHKAPGR